MAVARNEQQQKSDGDRPTMVYGRGGDLKEAQSSRGSFPEKEERTGRKRAQAKEDKKREHHSELESVRARE